MFQCYSLKSSHPHLLPQSPKVCSLHLCLFRCLIYRVIVTIFLNSVCMHWYTVLLVFFLAYFTLYNRPQFHPPHYKRWGGCGQKGTLLHCWWECKLVQPPWRTVWRFLKKFKADLPYDPATPLLGIHTKETRIERNMYPSVHHSTVHNS